MPCENNRVVRKLQFLNNSLMNERLSFYNTHICVICIDYITCVKKAALSPLPVRYHFSGAMTLMSFKKYCLPAGLPLAKVIS